MAQRAPSFRLLGLKMREVVPSSLLCCAAFPCTTVKSDSSSQAGENRRVCLFGVKKQDREEGRFLFLSNGSLLIRSVKVSCCALALERFFDTKSIRRGAETIQEAILVLI